MPPAPRSTQPTPSRPVVIPSRSQQGRNEASAQVLRPPSKRPSEEARSKHDPTAIPPALSALLAVTTIPRPSSRSSLQQWRFQDVRGSQCATPTCLGDVRSKSSERDLLALSKTPMDILLSPPEDDDDVFIDPNELTDATLSVHSTSSDSMPSLSLSSEASTPSPTNPPTPTSRPRLALRKARTLSSPPSESCPLDHPLRASSPPPSPTITAPSFLPPPPPSSRRSSSQPSAFKSNLTHSLTLLRAAARTLPTHPLSLLSTTLLTPDEPRPTTTPFTPATTSSSLSSDSTSRACTTSIQLSTYHSNRSPTTNDPPPSSIPSPLPPVTTPSPHQQDHQQDQKRQQRPSLLPTRPRELRENPDFLRVVVLEMNMRRVGKLRDEGGRARFVLPARKTAEVDGVGVAVGGLSGGGAGPSRRRRASTWAGFDSDADDARAEAESVHGQRARATVPKRWVGMGVGGDT
ncbi:MAG: hypothetical protein M1833_006847 [Piccolia ochrophora]|nr:MAG: hypothetical protein M1833_006847 [Piccolia ochrophora]